MYRHNPLPKSKSRQKNNRSIIFSSPKFDKFNETMGLSKKTRSQSKQRSMHRIDSKQKPKMLFSPSRKKRNIQTSTSAGGNQSQTQPFSRFTPGSSGDSGFISVSQLLHKRTFPLQPTQATAAAAQTQPPPLSDITIVRKTNSPPQDLHEKLVLIKQIERNLERISIKSMIQLSCWGKYEGEFSTIQGKFHGYGTLTMFSGSKFMGFFQHGLPQGNGTYYSTGSSKTAINGIWHQGQQLQTL